MKRLIAVLMLVAGAAEAYTMDASKPTLLIYPAPTVTLYPSSASILWDSKQPETDADTLNAETYDGASLRLNAGVVSVSIYMTSGGATNYVMVTIGDGNGYGRGQRAGGIVVTRERPVVIENIMITKSVWLHILPTDQGTISGVVVCKRYGVKRGRVTP